MRYYFHGHKDYSDPKLIQVVRCIFDYDDYIPNKYTSLVKKIVFKGNGYGLTQKQRSIVSAHYSCYLYQSYKLEENNDL